MHINIYVNIYVLHPSCLKPIFTVDEPYFLAPIRSTRLLEKWSKRGTYFEGKLIFIFSMKIIKSFGFSFLPSSRLWQLYSGYRIWTREFILHGSEMNLCFWRNFLSFSCFLPAILLQVVSKCYCYCSTEFTVLLEQKTLLPPVHFIVLHSLTVLLLSRLNLKLT